MKEKWSIRDLMNCWQDVSGKTISVNGWIRTSRNSKNFGFIEINDGTCFKNIQIVYDASLTNYEQVQKLHIASALKITGEVVATPDAKQDFEIKACMIEILGSSEADYPLQKKRHSMEYLRTIAHLRPRSNTYSAVFRVRSEAAFAIHKFFNDRHFVYCHTPLITASDAEGAGETFTVTTLDFNDLPQENGVTDMSKDFFGKQANLSVSGQLEGETFAQAFQNIYTFGPSFRAEHSNTTRHLAEFWQIEPEIAFADLEDNMDLAEAMLKSILTHVLTTCPEEMAFFDQRISKGLLDKLNLVRDATFERITYTRAIEDLLASGKTFEYKVEWGAELQTEHEKYLVDELYKKPIFVSDYPKQVKSFYMRLNDDGKTVAAMDLLVPGIGEIIGGSQREERYDLLLNRIEELQLNMSEYWWYLELRKYGTTKHAGFGLGFERLIMYITGMSNIRDVIPFPRTVGTAEF